MKFQKRKSTRVGRYFLCSCKDNIECMLGHLTHLSPVLRQRWLDEEGHEFISRCSSNPIKQAECLQKLKEGLKEIYNLKDRDILTNIPIHLGDRDDVKIDYTKIQYYAGRFKGGVGDYHSLFLAAEITGICRNKILYGICNNRDSVYKNWYFLSDRGHMGAVYEKERSLKEIFLEEKVKKEDETREVNTKLGWRSARHLLIYCWFINLYFFTDIGLMSAIYLIERLLKKEFLGEKAKKEN